MSYTKTNWVNGTTPLNDKNMNKIENALENLDTNMNKIENALENLDTNISKSTDEYSSTRTYSIGELVIYNNKLYKANQDITTAEAFNSSHWTEVTLLSDVNKIKSVVNNNADNLNKLNEGIANAVEKTGDTLTGDLNMQSNSVKFGNNGNVLWKEDGFGDKFRILPNFNGAGAENKLIIQSTTGEAGTDPQNWKDLVTIHADSGGVYNGVSGKKLVETSDLLNLIYPVGSIYMSVNSTSPATLFGGTWEQIKDRFLLSAGNTYSAGETGGEATHKLTIDEMPSHNHTWGWRNSTASGNSSWNSAGNDKTGSSSDIIGNTGGGKPHNNMPPYLAVYMWKRTA